MLFRTILGLLITVIVCSCARQSPKNGPQVKDGLDRHLPSKTGLKIENGINRRITPNDSLGITHFLIHATSIITNDSTIPIHLQIALSKEYEFPTLCNDKKYRVFLLPKEQTPNTATLYDRIINGFDDFIKTCLDNPYIINKTLKPGENCEITIGTLYPSPTNCGVVPRAVFSHDNKGLYHACDRQLPARSAGGNQPISSDPQFEIGVKLEFYNQRKFIGPEDHCTVIPFGQISYLEY